MRLILKTMVSSEAEIPFLWMMFSEAAPYVERIIVTEFDHTHSGLEREFLFQRHVEEFARAFPQLDYLQGANVPGIIEGASSPEEQHHNERLMRGWWASKYSFRSKDVIFSTDADEVLYDSTYRWVLDHFSWRTSRGVKFRLHHFFFRPNLLWLDSEFVAPVALRFGRYAREYPNQWRYQGFRLSGYWGAHFSWCMPVSDMEKKVVSYSHAAEHGHLRGRELFEHARKYGVLPFGNTNEKLHEISYGSPLIPKSFFSHAHRLDPEVLGPHFPGPQGQSNPFSDFSEL